MRLERTPVVRDTEKHTLSGGKAICPECGREMEWKGTIDPGNDEGRFRVALYQCPNCKNIESDE
jgi:hypothetical protein